MRVTALFAFWVAGCIVSTDDNLWKHRDANTKETTVTTEGSVPQEGQPFPDAHSGPTDGPQGDDVNTDGPIPDSRLDLPLPDTQLLSNGSTCSLPNECASGHCVDLVCCDTGCGGLCEACDLPGTKGTCTLVKAGTDPDDECAQKTASTCGTNGFCDGKGACQLHASGTSCGPPSCVKASTRPRECDGKGKCVDGPKTSCLPFKCNTATGVCFKSCSSDAQCVAYRCGWFTKKCRQSCSTDFHCQSGFTCKNNKCVN